MASALSSRNEGERHRFRAWARAEAMDLRPDATHAAENGNRQFCGNEGAYETSLGIGVSGTRSWGLPHDGKVGVLADESWRHRASA